MEISLDNGQIDALRKGVNLVGQYTSKPILQIVNPTKKHNDRRFFAKSDGAVANKGFFQILPSHKRDRRDYLLFKRILEVS